MPVIPEREQLLAVIGGRSQTGDAALMAELLGSAIVAAGLRLVTGGRAGAGEAAARGAAGYCASHDLDPAQWVFTLIPFGAEPDFAIGRVTHAGKDRFERRLILMRCCQAAFVVGGGSGTERELMHAAVDDYMAWGCASVLPVAGTGGAADRLLALNQPYGDALLDGPAASEEKAQRLVAAVGRHHFALFGFWGVDIHEGWLTGSRHPVVRETLKIRHYPIAEIRVEGECPG